jgi:hypothetical protein
MILAPFIFISAAFANFESPVSHVPPVVDSPYQTTNSPCLDSVLLNLSSQDSCEIKTYRNEDGALGYYCQAKVEDEKKSESQSLNLFESVTFWTYKGDLSHPPSRYRHYNKYCTDNNLTVFYY